MQSAKKTSRGFYCFAVSTLFSIMGCQSPNEKLTSAAVDSDYIRISFSGRENLEGMKILLASKEDKEMFAQFIGFEIEPVVACNQSGKVEFMLNGKPKSVYKLSLQEGCNYLERDNERVSLTESGIFFLGTRYDTYQKINFSTLDSISSLPNQNSNFE